MALNTGFIQDPALPNNIERKEYVAYIDLGTPESHEWYAIGKGVRTSGVQRTVDETNEPDIFGEKHKITNSVTETQSFEPFPLERDSKFAQILFDMDFYGQLDREFDILRVYGFAGNPGEYAAKIDRKSTLTLGEIAATDQYTMPFTLNFSNNVIRGTADKNRHDNAVVFTEETAAAPIA